MNNHILSCFFEPLAICHKNMFWWYDKLCFLYKNIDGAILRFFTKAYFLCLVWPQPVHFNKKLERFFSSNFESEADFDLESGARFQFWICIDFLFWLQFTILESFANFESGVEIWEQSSLDWAKSWILSPILNRQLLKEDFDTGETSMFDQGSKSRTRV